MQVFAMPSQKFYTNVSANIFENLILQYYQF